MSAVLGPRVPAEALRGDKLAGLGEFFDDDAVDGRTDLRPVELRLRKGAGAFGFLDGGARGGDFHAGVVFELLAFDAAFARRLARSKAQWAFSRRARVLARRPSASSKWARCSASSSTTTSSAGPDAVAFFYADPGDEALKTRADLMRLWLMM